MKNQLGRNTILLFITGSSTTKYLCADAKGENGIKYSCTESACKELSEMKRTVKAGFLCVFVISRSGVRPSSPAPLSPY